MLDNYATRKHAEVKRWFEAHARFHVHFVPTGSSWLNLVERWFAEITRKRIRRGTFRIVPELVRAIMAYLRENNTQPRPFIRSASVATILYRIRHCEEALNAGH